MFSSFSSSQDISTEGVWLSDTFGERVIEVLSGGLGSFLEIALLARTFTMALLQERNVVLTKNIRKACRDLAKQNEKSTSHNSNSKHSNPKHRMCIH